MNNSILILSDSFYGYGAEHMLKWLGNTLCQKGFNVSFCSIFDKERDKELDSNARYLPMLIPSRVYDLNYFIKGVKQLRNICNRHAIDVVITFHTNPFLMALLAKPFCRYKTLHSERDNPYARNTTASRFKSWLFRYSDRIVFQTKGAQNFFDWKTVHKSVIIPNPVFIPDFEWQQGFKKTIVTVGRLDVRYKRQDLLIDAFAEILCDFPEYQLVLYGEGKDREYLESKSKELNIQRNVIFAGKVSGIMSKLCREGVFVMTSDSEGMPNALMEAMAIGMPVISTDCEPGGARALITNDVDGILIKRSSKNELVLALRRLLGNKILQIRLGKNARNKMRNFNPDTIANYWVNVIKH